MLTSIAQAFAVTLLSLFPVMNPFGNLPAFVALTQGDSPADRHRQAYQTALYVALLLAVFTVAGKPLLHALGISIAALQIAGGLVVVHAAFGMVTGTERLTPDDKEQGRQSDDVSFTPMAIPLLAGPGSIGIVIALAARSSGAGPIVGILLGSVVMAALAGVVLRVGEPLLERLGPAGVAALTRVFSFLILAVGVELVVHGVLAVAPALAG